MSQAASVLGKALDLSGLNWERRKELLTEELEPRERQLVDKFQENLAEQGNAREETVQPVVLPRPAVQRTYSRRGRGQVKQSLSRSQTPVSVAPTPPPCPSDKEVVSLLPPSRASL